MLFILILYTTLTNGASWNNKRFFRLSKYVLKNRSHRSPHVVRLLLPRIQREDLSKSVGRLIYFLPGTNPSCFPTTSLKQRSLGDSFNNPASQNCHMDLEVHNVYKREKYLDWNISDSSSVNCDWILNRINSLIIIPPCQQPDRSLAAAAKPSSNTRLIQKQHRFDMHRRKPNKFI